MSAPDRPLTVVHVQKFAGVAGSEGHLRQLPTTFDRARVEPRLLMLGHGADPRERDFVEALRAAAVRVDRLPIRLDIDPLLIARLWAWFRRERPDVVHTHLLHADVHAGPAARMAGVPVIISTKHNDDRFRRLALVGWMERALGSWTDRTITISDALRSFHLRQSGVDQSRVTTIHYGYDPLPAAAPDPGDARRELGLPEDVPVILAVGRLVEQKGHDVLLRAVPLMRRTPAEPHVAIVGEGDRRTALAALARDLGIATRVHLMGWRGDVPRLMRAATLLAHPARWEGFGLVLLEAMAARLPIVATAVSAIPEIVETDQSGVVVPPDDPPALAQALDRLLGDPPLCARLADRAHRRLTAQFSPVRMVRAHEELYDAAMRDTRRTRR
jgi:glycosyltransferase involved in cell wall biosynthesis